MRTGQKLSKFQTRHIEHVKNFVAKAVNDYKMIAPGDRVLAAVSGGKDSLVMLEALSVLRKFDSFDYELEALHIDVTDVPYQVDQKKLFGLAESLQVKLHILKIKADLEQRGKKAPCFVCSWHRRKALFEFAKENGFRKLAFGHHMDDAVETLLINMAYHGNISSMPGKLSMFDGALDSIRPLILLTNKDTAEFARIRNYPELTAKCPYENQTFRKTARGLITELEQLHPKAKWNLFNSMGNIDQEYLP
ncbi:MAG: tRNA 2-thiocytidine(32) synthetase TtcA [Bacteroidetes bacterium]|nr:MAG: tRNA 2-thiocytidine(32) synthetase TtcA [Bacteroidota bacterium]